MWNYRSADGQSHVVPTRLIVSAKRRADNTEKHFVWVVLIISWISRDRRGGDRSGRRWLLLERRLEMCLVSTSIIVLLLALSYNPVNDSFVCKQHP